MRRSNIPKQRRTNKVSSSQTMQQGTGTSSKATLNPARTEKETVLRELQEETGITDATFIEGFKETIAYFYRRQGLTVHKEVVFFVMESHTEKVEIILRACRLHLARL